MSAATQVLAGIRKSLIAGGGAAVTGAVGVLTADGWQFGAITQAQASSVIALALAAAVATYGFKNGSKVAPVVAAVEQRLADVGGTVFVKDVSGPLAQLQSDLAAANLPIVSILAPTVPLPADAPPADTYGGHAATAATLSV